MEHTMEMLKEQVKLEPPDEYEIAEPPPKLSFGPPLCIICEKPNPIKSMLFLTVSEASELLSASCFYGKKIEQAKIKICQKPLMRCKMHEEFCYEMMCKATGATCEFDIEEASIEKMLKLYECYKQIKDARDAMDRNPPTCPVTLGHFISMIKSFFNKHAPIWAYVGFQHKLDEEQIEKLSSPNATLRDLLSTRLEPEEKHRLLMSIKRAKSRSAPQIIDEFIRKRRATKNLTSSGAENSAEQLESNVVLLDNLKTELVEQEEEPATKRARKSKYFEPDPSLKKEKEQCAPGAPVAPIAPPPSSSLQFIPKFNIVTYRPRITRKRRSDRKPVVICPVTGGFVRVSWEQEEELAEQFELSTEPLRIPDHLLEEKKPEFLLE